MKKGFISIFFTGCVLLSGCNNSAQNSSDAGKKSSPATDVSTDNWNMIRDTENVKFKYDQPQDAAHSADIYSYSNAEVSMESYLKLFSEEPSCEKETFPNGFREEYTFGDESGSIMNRDGILVGVDYHTSQGFSYLAVEDGTEVADETTKFDFISRKEVSEKLSLTVNELLGMDIQVKINAVTADRFSKDVETHINNVAQLDDNPPTADKYGTPADFYLVSFVQSIDGVPVVGCFGNAVFTAKGLELLSVYSPLKSTEKVSKSNEFINLDGAEKLLKDKYELLFLDEPVNVENAELTYIIADGKLTPTWKFTFFGGIIEYYDAYTGKEIVVNMGEGA